MSLSKTDYELYQQRRAHRIHDCAPELLTGTASVCGDAVERAVRITDSSVCDRWRHYCSGTYDEQLRGDVVRQLDAREQDLLKQLEAARSLEDTGSYSSYSAYSSGESDDESE